LKESLIRASDHLKKHLTALINVIVSRRDGRSCRDRFKEQIFHFQIYRSQDVFRIAPGETVQEDPAVGTLGYGQAGLFVRVGWAKRHVTTPLLCHAGEFIQYRIEHNVCR
jgi:hypothetical protein